MTPKPQRGINYSDLSRIVMERARSAREAVEIVGSLVNKYGDATYGGNSHLFADRDEGWVLIEFAGGMRKALPSRSAVPTPPVTPASSSRSHKFRSRSSTSR